MKKYLILLKKEFLLLGRQWELILSILFFTFLVILIFQFAFGAEGAFSDVRMTPIIWIATLFGGSLKLSRTFEPELKNRVIDGLKTIPGIALPLYFSKLTINFLSILMLCLAAFAAVIFLFNIADPLHYALIACLPFLLGIFGFVCVGTTFSGFVSGGSHRDLLLTIILYPILVPLIIGVMKSLESSENSWLVLLGLADLIYLILSLLVFDLILES